MNPSCFGNNLISETELFADVVIVGGGSAGWLTAGIIAAKYVSKIPTEFQVVLIESPDISPIGVGEGTWPSMRTTLQTIGISETDFFRECDASFKQGSKFSGWTSIEKVMTIIIHLRYPLVIVILI